MLLPAGQKRVPGILKQDRRPPGPPPGAPAYMTDDEGSDNEDSDGALTERENVKNTRKYR